MKKVICPYCKGEEFLKTTREEVKITKDEYGLTDELIRELYTTYTCLNCHKELTEEDILKN